MRRSAADWDEDYVLSLPQGEHDWFERKGSKLLDLNAGAKEGHVRSELGKQLSAFANFGGGQIIYGVTDVGEIDNGGVSQSVRHGTKEWLEDIIPNLTEFEVVGVNVYPIFSTSSTSKIEQGKAVYVIDVPDSDRAPHQASDAKVYYVRSGGKSRPASHRLVEDIRNRAKHPNVDVSIELGEFRMHLDPRQPSIRGKASLPLTIRATNICPLKSQNTCLCLKLEGIPVDTNQHLPEFQRRYLGRKNDETFWEALHPLYPGMDVSVPQIHNLEFNVCSGVPTSPRPFWSFPGTMNPIADTPFRWRVFADNAPMKEGDGTLKSLEFNGRMREALVQLPEGLELIRIFNVP